MSPRVEAVGVVVPARDEDALLPAALRALSAATRAAKVGGWPAIDVVVVADSCTDRTAEVARSLGARVLEVRAGSVGRARSLGADSILGRIPGVDLRSVWLATTDADSAVPRDWLVHQLDLAEAGADLVLGTVDVRDWGEHPATVERAWRASYDAHDGHGHVHGANAGTRADVYLEAGGFADVELDEDVGLAAALQHRNVVRTGRIPVLTSARRVSRVPGGFADHLGGL